jgi:hypothetical protein
MMQAHPYEKEAGAHAGAHAGGSYEGYKDHGANPNSSGGTLAGAGSVVLISPQADAALISALTALGFSSADSSFGPAGGKSSSSTSSTVRLVGIYTAVLFVVLVVFSGLDFSVLMTVGSLTRCFGLTILLSQIVTAGTAAGISLKSLQLYALTFLLRLSSILRHEGYLPYDKTGDWLLHLLEFISLVISGAGIFFLMKHPYQRTYDEASDSFGSFHIPSKYGAAYLAAPCLVLAILVHPNLNGDFFSDVGWTASMYLESLSIVPQLYMIQRGKKKSVDMLTAHFVVSLGLARAMDGIFWMFSFKELVSKNSGALPGYLALISQLVHIVVLADFFYYYMQALKKGSGSMALPTHGGLADMA